jgi:hypothetical protein
VLRKYQRFPLANFTKGQCDKVFVDFYTTTELTEPAEISQARRSGLG